MLPYQTKYIQNAREIVRLSDVYGASLSDFEAWYTERREANAKMGELKKENIALLSACLFPMLDDLHNASAEDIANLEEFAAVLLDWSANLDCGLYVLIHDSLLSMYRIRQDRNNIIKELYKVGMGMYYLLRPLRSMKDKQAVQLCFENEMLFTEGGSYLKFFPVIQDEETKGYIIRSLANISICTEDKNRRIAVSSNILKIVQDDYYRSLAPSLPWDVFLRRTHQQMSSNRTVLSKVGLTTRELMEVLESCHEVFKPESVTDNPNVRWLWPYYEMEYTCGFVDLHTTMDRLEHLILSVPTDQHDDSSLYANIQLPIYYGDLLRKNPSMRSNSHHAHFLVRAYQRMIRTVLSYPVGKINEMFLYDIRLLMSEYLETEGVESYRSVAVQLMRRFFGRLYIRALKASALLRRYCEEIWNTDPGFFDDIPFLAEMKQPEEKKRALLDYADGCGMFHDFGMLHLNLERTTLTRNLFETEDQMLKLHTRRGCDALRKYASTEIFADVALGHHAWYQGGGYPEDYERLKSPYRQMTDVVAVVAYLLDHDKRAPDKTIQSVIAQEQKRFSPLVTVYLGKAGLREDLSALLSGDERLYYQEFHRHLTGEGQT